MQHHPPYLADRKKNRVTVSNHVNSARTETSRPPLRCSQDVTVSQGGGVVGYGLRQPIQSTTRSNGEGLCARSGYVLVTSEEARSLSRIPGDMPKKANCSGLHKHSNEEQHEGPPEAISSPNEQCNENRRSAAQQIKLRTTTSDHNIYYEWNDKRLLTMNQVPYLAHEKIGTGASAAVFRIEILIPKHTELVLDEAGEPQKDKDGFLHIVPVGEESITSNEQRVTGQGHWVGAGIFYALKLIYLPSNPNERDKANQLRALHAYEISLLDQLKDHDQIVQIYDSEVRASSILLLLELAVSDFETWLKKDCHQPDQKQETLLKVKKTKSSAIRNLTPIQILEIWSQLVNAVTAIHEKSVIHFDIKPSNILITGTRIGVDGSEVPILKLADFGLSRQLQGSQSHISARGGWGTLKYMAPEVVHQPEESFEFRADIDIWSIGVILHQLLHGGETAHDYLLRGKEEMEMKMRLALGIADPRALRANQDVTWILEAFPPSQHHLQGTLLRDFFLKSQNACLTFFWMDRPKASTLKKCIDDTKEILENLDELSKSLNSSFTTSENSRCRSDFLVNDVRSRPALAKLLSGTDSTTSKNDMKRISWSVAGIFLMFFIGCSVFGCAIFMSKVLQKNIDSQPVPDVEENPVVPLPNSPDGSSFLSESPDDSDSSGSSDWGSEGDDQSVTSDASTDAPSSDEADPSPDFLMPRSRNHRRSAKGKNLYQTSYTEVKSFDGRLYLASSSDVSSEVEKPLQGRGTYSLPTGSVYKGSLSDGKFSGYGTLIYVSGEQFKGTWSDGKPLTGEGTYIQPDGRKFEGAFKEGKPEGNGKLTYPNGKEWNGTWVKGEMVCGKGWLEMWDSSSARSEIWDGEMTVSDGIIEFNGTATFDDGRELTGCSRFSAPSVARATIFDWIMTDAWYKKTSESGETMEMKFETKHLPLFRSLEASGLEVQCDSNLTMAVKYKYAKGSTLEGDLLLPAVSGSDADGDTRKFVPLWLKRPQSDGTLIESELMDDKFSGVFKVTLPDGSKYDGKVREGSMFASPMFTHSDSGKPLEGYGTYRYVNDYKQDTKTDGCYIYKGSLLNGKFEGAGTLIAAHGDELEGVWSDGELTDKMATYRWSGGVVFTGEMWGDPTEEEWVWEGKMVPDAADENSKREPCCMKGEPACKEAEGFFFKKGFLAFIKEEYSCGCRIEGAKSCFHGKQKRRGKQNVIFCNGDHLSVPVRFKDGKIHGETILKMTDGCESRSIYVDGEIQPESGTYKFSTGSVFNGYTQDEEPHGMGTLTLPDGRVIRGKLYGDNESDFEPMISDEESDAESEDSDYGHKIEDSHHMFLATSNQVDDRGFPP